METECKIGDSSVITRTENKTKVCECCNLIQPIVKRWSFVNTWKCRECWSTCSAIATQDNGLCQINGYIMMKNCLTKKCYVYIIECKDSRYYTGETKNPKVRMEQHKTGKGGAKFTKSFGFNELVMLIECEDKSAARKEEWRIKHKLSKEEKLDLIEKNIQETIRLKKFFDL